MKVKREYQLGLREGSMSITASVLTWDTPRGQETVEIEVNSDHQLITDLDGLKHMVKEIEEVIVIESKNEHYPKQQ